MNNNIHQITMKELEQIIFRQLQKSFSEAMVNILVGLDNELAKNRDKSRYRLKDKRILTMDSMFDHVELKRNYYYDIDTNEYVYLLDQYLDFDGRQMMSPAIQDLAIELAVTGPSYRQASQAIERLIGYPVISHEGIRQKVLCTDVLPKEKETIKRDVLFVEVDGLYTKSQEKGIKGKELKIAATHQGWEQNGKRTRLKDKRHFVYREKLPFWEEFEQFLFETYDYEPTHHHLVINGDGANWITSCREYFTSNATFVIDKFHVARDVESIFREHPRLPHVKKKLRNYDVDGFMVELNSAVGTIENEQKEERLENLISQLSQYPEALNDYRVVLEEKGINTDGFRPMGSAEGTMRVFAKRLKNGRSWVKEGIAQFSDLMVGLMDGKEILTTKGKFKSQVSQTFENSRHENPPKFFLEKISNRVKESTRNNISYLQQSVNSPIVRALKGLQGF